MFAIGKNRSFILSTLSCYALSGGLFLLAHTAGILLLSAEFHVSFHEISLSQKLVELVELNRLFNETIHTRI